MSSKAGKGAIGTIEFDKVVKTYSVAKGKYGLLRDILAEKLTSLKGKRNDSATTIQALKNINFNIGHGECVGMIGRNGAGKSTILKLISKITYPEKGTIKVHGKISAFIELGAGLHHELTGTENIYLYGAILGMKKNEIKENFSQIVKFAGIKKFLDVPIKKYSSGMYSRLGFSVCAFSSPDILLVDEVLAVGDINFQKKCLEKMHSFVGSKTIVFVSHNMEAVQSICTRVIYIEKGKILADGKPKKVIDLYIKRSKQDQS